MAIDADSDQRAACTPLAPPQALRAGYSHPATESGFALRPRPTFGVVLIASTDRTAPGVTHRNAFERAITGLDEHLAPLAGRDRDLFRLRLARRFDQLHDGLHAVYGARADFPTLVQRLLALLARTQVERPESLRLLDIGRDLSPGWFQHESMLGYVAYVERFGQDLNGVTEQLDYLDELGVSYLHLMKLMHAREGENDGGYAIVDYTGIDPAMGTREDLVSLCDALRSRGISLCVDLVLNHCAQEHPWAMAASAGDERYRDYFHFFADREMPDAYEASLPEVFPDFAPGNFTFDEPSGHWVWTTFNHYQWDLNWSNPEVFLEIVQAMMTLANLGVEVFRLDAVAFMWKRIGTDSQNQEEVYDLLQALRACSAIATPAVAHKAEAIVAPDDLIRYFGIGKRHGKVANVAYHNSLMVQFWSSLASGDTTLMTHALDEFPRTPDSIAWGTYIRCHDDIGWAIADDDAAAVGLSGHAHRVFLSDWYAGLFPGSESQGGIFQYNPDTNDRRINGSFAALVGLQGARERGDEPAIDLAIERMLLGHALICGFGGLPLIYMGDEIGLPNDPHWQDDPAHAGDSRWMHRPSMDWRAAARRHDPLSVEGRLFDGLLRIVAARRTTPQLDARYDTDIVRTGHPRLFTIAHRHPLGTLAGVYNLTGQTQWLRADVLQGEGVQRPWDRLTQAHLPVIDAHVEISPYARYWLVEASTG